MTDRDDFSLVAQLPNGAAFVRGDLHIHSVVGSHDVSDAAATPEEIVRTALREGLSVIAIADHNEIDGVEAAIQAAAGQPLLVVPAIELSTMHGHLLCYLPTLDALKRFHSQLSVRDSGQPNSRVENGMVDCLNRVQALGGFGVLAHVDGPKGLDTVLPGGGPHKADIIAHPALLGIELKNASSQIRYAEGDPEQDRVKLGRERANRSNGIATPVARILNSDSHTIASLGRNASGDQKVTRYKLQTLSFDALKLAFLDADARIRLEDELVKAVPVVKALRLKGGFLKDQAIHLNPNLNCIIGGRGTGKSTTFEALRVFSPFPSGNSVVNSDVWADRTDISFVDQAGQEHHLAWSKGDISPTNTLDPITGPETIPLECYGQGETQKISQKAQDDPGALLAYLDRFTDVAQELVHEESARIAISEMEAKVAEARGKVALIPQFERDLGITRQQIKKLEEGKAKEIIELSRQLEAERQARAQIVIQAKLIGSSFDYNTVKTAITALKSAADPNVLVVGKDEYLEIAACVTEFESGLTATEGQLKLQSDALGEKVREKVAEWTAKEKTLLADIERRTAALEAGGVSVDTAYITKLTNDEASLNTSVNNLKTWIPHLADLEIKRDELIRERWAARSAVAAKRKAFASVATKKLRTALYDLNVTLKFDANAYSPQAHSLLVEVMGWRTTQVQRATLVTQGLTVPKLLDCIHANDPGPIQALRTSDGVAVFNRAEAQAIIDRFREPDVLTRLQTVEVFDRPKLTVTRATQDDTGATKHVVREFGQLSLGQQQSVLLALMLSSDSSNPLLIDQPEDNLDGEFIFSQLVPVIRMAKERRQIIIVTHNANIAVLGDAEQIVVLKANNERAMIVSRGSIDDPDTKNAACAILEGARTAFVRRGKVYGLT